MSYFFLRRNLLKKNRNDIFLLLLLLFFPKENNETKNKDKSNLTQANFKTAFVSTENGFGKTIYAMPCVCLHMENLVKRKIISVDKQINLAEV